MHVRAYSLKEHLQHHQTLRVLIPLFLHHVHASVADAAICCHSSSRRASLLLILNFLIGALSRRTALRFQCSTQVSEVRHRPFATSA